MTGNEWLMILGITFVVLAPCFASQQRAGAWPLKGFIGCVALAALAVVSLILHLGYGDAFARESRPLWFWIFAAVIWLWAIVGEFHAWRKGRALI